jgi:AAA+ ATPase superfamily predicted ATPase
MKRDERKTRIQQEGKYMKNPFQPTGIVKDPAFCNREREQRELKKYIENSQNVLLYSHRRYGKTSLIFKVFSDLKKVNGVYVDLFGTTTVDDFLKNFLKAISVLETRGDHLSRVVRETLSSIGVNITLDTLTGSPTITPVVHAREKGRALEEVFVVLRKLSQKRKIAVAFDEFQEISGYGGDPFEKRLRKIIQQHGDVSYIFAGSQRHMLTQMFRDSNRAFYMMAASYPLKRIEPNDYVHWIEGLYAKDGRSISPSTIGDVVGRCENHPAYVQEFFFWVWDERKVTKELIDAVERRIIERQIAEFSAAWEALTINQRRALKLVASSVNGNLFTSDKLSMHGFRTASQLSTALQGLVNKGLVDRNGEYSVYDPLFRRWLQQA